MPVHIMKAPGFRTNVAEPTPRYPSVKQVPMTWTGMFAGGVRMPVEAPGARLKLITEALGVPPAWTASAVQESARTATIAPTKQRPTSVSLL